MVVRYKHDQLKTIVHDHLKGNIHLFLLLLQLEDGDIICFQNCSQVGSGEQCRYPDVPSFLEYVHNRQVSDEPLQCHFDNF